MNENHVLIRDYKFGVFGITYSFYDEDGEYYLISFIRRGGIAIQSTKEGSHSALEIINLCW